MNNHDTKKKKNKYRRIEWKNGVIIRYVIRGHR